MAISLTARIVMAKNRLESTPAKERGTYWDVATRQVNEAQQHNQRRDRQAAEVALESARKYIEVAAP
jgi:hypothetical protein